MKQTPQQFLQDNTLLFDGAMGTYLAQQFRSIATNCEQLNIDAPQRVLAVHRAYILAGANAIKTNTFGANCHQLNCNSQQLQQIITAGWQIAQQAAGEAANDTTVFVFADIGPIPHTEHTDIFAEYRQIVDIFIKLGCQNFLFETFPNTDCLPEIAGYIKEQLPNAFIITSFAVQPDGFTVNGEGGMALFAAMQSSLVDAVGFNCVSGPYHIKEYLKSIPQNLNTKLLSVMPNAGYPTVISNRTHFGSNPDYFADQILQIARLGAKIVGGCCGTTPEHIAAIAEALSHSKALPDSTNYPHISKTLAKPLTNHFRQKAEACKKLLAVELDPPANTELDGFMSKAQVLKNCGVDIITIPDCPIGRARMDSSLLACKLKRELNVDVLPHLTCRDRNLNATKALLLGLCAENINNVLIITGDPIPTAQRNEIKSVFNFNSRMLARYVSSLNQSELTTPFYLCGALNVNALNFDVQLRLAKEKIDGGMEMLLTQPILSKQAYDNLIRAKQELPAKILAGIMPVMSHRNAMFMNNEVAGITVCPEICTLYEGKTAEENRQLAVEIGTKIATAVLPHADGLYMISPFNRVDVIADICENLRADTGL